MFGHRVGVCFRLRRCSGFPRIGSPWTGTRTIRGSEEDIYIMLHLRDFASKCLSTWNEEASEGNVYSGFQIGFQARKKNGGKVWTITVA